ncbi:MAG: YtxH domain-containing protein [Streptococcaceae bacterium]|jgi:gas vesicle protein|nr:YtxH domain-containing protein [Streptococcaceae bacterium]
MSKKSGFLSGAFLGAVVAAGAALLLSPKPGKEIREDLKKQFEELKESEDPIAVAKAKREQAFSYAQDKKDEALRFIDSKTSGKFEDSLGKLQQTKQSVLEATDTSETIPENIELTLEELSDSFHDSLPKEETTPELTIDSSKKSMEG